MNKETLKLLLEALGYVLTPHGGTRAHVWDSDEARFVVQAYKTLEEALAKQEHGSPEDMYIEMHKHLNCPYCGGSGHIDDVKQEQGEPVAYFNPQVKGGFYWAKPTKITAPITVSVEPMPLYTTPQPAQKPLTDEQILRLLSRIDECAVRLPRGLREFARAIEAAHGIKENT